MLLAVASAVNVIGHIVLCTFLGYGIAGAHQVSFILTILLPYTPKNLKSNRERKKY